MEKNELLRILERLWRQEQRHKEEGDTMDDDSMCKICMDSPVANTFSSASILILIPGTDRLCDVGVRSHVHLHPMRQADGRVPHLSAICCQVFFSEKEKITTRPHALPSFTELSRLSRPELGLWPECVLESNILLAHIH